MKADNDAQAELVEQEAENPRPLRSPSRDTCFATTLIQSSACLDSDLFALAAREYRSNTSMSRRVKTIRFGHAINTSTRIVSPIPSGVVLPTTSGGIGFHQQRTSNPQQFAQIGLFWSISHGSVRPGVAFRLTTVIS